MNLLGYCEELYFHSTAGPCGCVPPALVNVPVIPETFRRATQKKKKKRKNPVLWVMPSDHQRQLPLLVFLSFFDWLPLSDWSLSLVISGNNNRALAQRLHGHSAPQSSWRTSPRLFTPPRRFRSSLFLSVSHTVSFHKVPIMLLAGVFGISSVPRSFAEKSVLNYSACVLCWRCVRGQFGLP